MTRAVLVMAYGGPDSLDDIEPYLLDIRGGRPTSPEFVAEIRERYARIGGRSPLLEITRAQAAGLEDCLNSFSTAAGGGPDYRVYVGMRHWKPYIREAVAQIAADGCREGLAFCMTPQSSRMSTGAYLAKLREAEAGLPAPFHLEFIESWYAELFLARALAAKARAALQKFPAGARGEVYYLFTAHSLPAAILDGGDPYPEQLRETARLVAAELGLSEGRWSFCYQSAGAAPGEWLGPSIEQILPDYARKGLRNILAIPVGFMADHVEVLYDLDIEAQEIARAAGIHLERSESLNASGDFIDGLSRFLLTRTQPGSADASR